MGGETTFKAVRYMCDRSGSCNWSRSVREQSSGVEGLYPLLRSQFLFFCLWVEMRWSVGP